MHSFFRKTLGGLNFPYYLRHFLFGLLLYAFLMFQLVIEPSARIPIDKLVATGAMLTLMQFLYPYSRFVYESIMGYIFGENVFFANAILVLTVKLFTIMLCWVFAWAIAPIGLIYLYFYYTKQEKQEKQANQQEP